MKIEFEKRVEDLPKWAPAAISIAAVVLAFVTGGIIFKIIGGEPFKVFAFFIRNTFGSWPAFFRHPC